MTATFTENNLHLILPSIISRVVEIISQQEQLAKLEALRRFYNSSTYKALENEPSKYWQLGCVALYEDYHSHQR